MLRACVIGCGHISEKHLKAISLLPNVKLVAVADCNMNRAVFAANKYKCIAYNNYKKMIEDTHPDAVHICTPHFLHAQIGRFALKKNINTIFEKPGAIEEDDFDELIGIQGRAKCISCVMFQNRLNNSSIEAKKIINSNNFGKILGCTANVLWSRNIEYYKVGKWRSLVKEAGGGVLVTQAIHTLDLMQFLLGEIENGNGLRTNILFSDIEVEDTFVANITFKNGCNGFLVATVANSCNLPAEINIYYENAVLKISGSNLSIIEKKQGIEYKTIVADNNVDICYSNSHEKVIKTFYEDINKGVTTLPSLNDAKQVFGIIKKLYSSCR